MILILDNKDSFVWNLAQALRALGPAVEVVRSDAVAVADLGRAQALVLSPGPGRPEHAGVTVAAVQRWSGSRPLLGVCLGHQAIGYAFGAAVRRGPPVHGRATPIHHDGQGVFADLPNPLSAARYHSLYVDDLPAELIATAHDEYGAVMALRHRTHATFGVQFHPESFLSGHGQHLLANFLRCAEAAA